MSFAAGLHAERQTFAEFCALLEAEREALARSDTEPLGSLAQAKTVCIDRLSDLAARRATCTKPTAP